MGEPTWPLSEVATTRPLPAAAACRSSLATTDRLACGVPAQPLLPCGRSSRRGRAAGSRSRSRPRSRARPRVPGHGGRRAACRGRGRTPRSGQGPAGRALDHRRRRLPLWSITSGSPQRKGWTSRISVWGRSARADSRLPSQASAAGVCWAAAGAAQASARTAVVRVRARTGPPPSLRAEVGAMFGVSGYSAICSPPPALIAGARPRGVAEARAKRGHASAESRGSGRQQTPRPWRR